MRAVHLTEIEADATYLIQGLAFPLIVQPKDTSEIVREDGWSVIFNGGLGALAFLLFAELVNQNDGTRFMFKMNDTVLCDEAAAGYGLIHPTVFSVPDVCEWAVDFAPRATTETDILTTLTDEQRMELFGRYCTYCGRPDPSCQCWNDE